MRCWYTRWQMSDALDRGELASRMARGHAARCAACQAFGRRLEALHDQLASGARAAALPVLARRRVPRRLLIAGPLAVGAAAVVAVAIGGIAPVERAVAPPAPAEVSGTLIRVRHVADRVSRALASTPLDTELDDLIRDGKRGLDTVLSLGGLR